MATYWEYNSEYDSIEIYFDYIPDKELRDEMKSNGWRWHRTKKCWYNFDNEENEDFADEICKEDEDEEINNRYDLENQKIDLSKYTFTKKLVECVDCGKMISSHAMCCLGCGAPIDYIKEVYVKRDLERKKRDQIAKDAAERRKKEEEKRAKEREKQAREEEIKRILQAKKIEEEARLKQEQAKKEAEQRRKDSIKEFRNEFGATELYMNDAEVLRAISYLSRNAIKIGYANYKIGDRVVWKITKHNGEIGFKLYKTSTDVIFVSF